MKPFQIHPVSALAGAALLGLVLLSTGAIQVTKVNDAGSNVAFPPGGGGVPLTIDNPIQVLGIPTPQQLVRIEQGVPFDVPSGKIFVATGILPYGGDQNGSVAFAGTVQVRFDNVIVARLTEIAFGEVPRIAAGLTANAGVSITVANNNASIPVALLGYLADA